MSDLPIPDVMLAVADLAIALGVAPINRLPGAWVHRVDGNWTIAMHAHTGREIDVEPEGCMGIPDLRPFTVVVWWNGWLAGLVDPTGGTLAAGTGANEDTLLAALLAATAAAQGDRVSAERVE